MVSRVNPYRDKTFPKQRFVVAHTVRQTQIFRITRQLGSSSSLMALPWQATDVPQPSRLIVPPALDFHLWSLDAPAPIDAVRTLAAEVGTYGRRMTDNFA
jgi:hypothetical protein